MADQQELTKTTCIGCVQHDDHPKHRHVVGGDQPDIFWHMDCHLIALAGEECAICTPARAGADGLTGHEFRAHIVSASTARQES